MMTSVVFETLSITGVTVQRENKCMIFLENLQEVFNLSSPQTQFRFFFCRGKLRNLSPLWEVAMNKVYMK